MKNELWKSWRWGYPLSIHPDAPRDETTTTVVARDGHPEINNVRPTPLWSSCSRVLVLFTTDPLLPCSSTNESHPPSSASRVAADGVEITVRVEKKARRVETANGKKEEEEASGPGGTRSCLDEDHLRRLVIR